MLLTKADDPFKMPVMDWPRRRVIVARLDWLWQVPVYTPGQPDASVMVIEILSVYPN
jgi:hypothetical protein